MANLLKQFVNHFGVDLKSSDITRENQFASDMLNAEYRKNGNISKRQGYRTGADEAGGQGLANYNRIDTTTGFIDKKIIAISTKLEELEEATITVSYSGAELSVIFEVFFDPDADEYKVQIVEGTVLVLDFSLGKGIDEVTPVTLAGMKTAIDAVTDFTATISGETTIPAAYIDFARGVNLAEGDCIHTARSWVDVNQPLASLLPGNATEKDNVDFEISSWVQINNVLFISNGYDNIIKYDGQNAYYAGLPQHDLPSAAIGVAGVLSSTYRYNVVYSEFDAAGNLVQGNISETSADLVATSDTIDVTVNQLEDTTGFNTNCAIVAGAQGPVNVITVDDGAAGSHTMKVGDTAYFFDSVSAGYVEREVTAIGATTITVAGAAVTVTDNLVISNNLRIGIYRNLAGGTVGFLVEEIPNNSFVSSITYNDNIVDGSLGIELLQPVNKRDQPPKGKHIASYNNQLLVCGDLENPNLLFISEPGQPEHFFVSTINLRLQSANGDKLTGVKQNNEVLAVFEDRAVHVITGDIPNFQVRVETLTKDVGCIAHATIQEVRGDLYFLGDRGVYSLISGQLPREKSIRVEPVFDINATVEAEQVPQLKRAVAVNHRAKEQYILYIPTESFLGTERYGNDFSFIITEDYFRGAWLRWDNMNMRGGAVVRDRQLHFTETRNSTALGAIANYLYIQNDRGDSWDYNDNDEPTVFEYSSSWYHLDEPSVFKKFNRFKLFGTDETPFNQYRVDIDIESDFISDKVIGTFDIDFTDNAFGYGISNYGIAAYGDVTDANRKHKIGPIKSKGLRFVIKNQEALQNVDITGWELEIQTPYRQTIKE